MKISFARCASLGYFLRMLGVNSGSAVEGNLKFIFLGGQRVAAVTNSPSIGSTTLYYHADHLGGANVLTDATGFKKELIEYEPFGLESRHEKYGSSEEVAWYYFTGKPKDDETGLIYFGARYYDPKLGRFITPDTIVQNPSDPQTLNRYSYCGNNPINRIDLDGHKWSWGKFFKAVGIAIVGTVLTVMSAGTLTPLVGAYWAGVAGGALAGATIGGTFAAGTGGNIGMGLLTGAVGGAVFAGLAPGLSTLSNGLARGMTLGGAAGPLTSGVSIASNFTAGFLGGAASGSAVAGVGGGDIGNGALMGGLATGGFSLVRSMDQIMWSKMAAQSARGSMNNSIPGLPPKGGVGKYGGTPLGGSRFDPNIPFSDWVKNPAPLGGLQGSTGKIFGMSYSGNSFWHEVVETYAGAHDFLNSWAHDNSTGYLRNLNGFESTVGAFTNPLNVAIATPIAVPSALPQTFNSASSIVYGQNKKQN